MSPTDARRQPHRVSDGSSIVLLGSFNPPILQPAWFAAHGLVPESEAEEADIEIVHRDLVVFRLPWCELQVTRERFHLSSAEAPTAALIHDLAVGTFDILSHTPVHAMGLNRNVHYEMPSIDSWHKVGRELVPSEKWSTFLREPGMRSLTVEGLREDDRAGYVRVRVEPSNRVPHGVYIEVNNHLGPVDSPASEPNREVIAVLVEDWGPSQERADEAIKKVVGLYE
jgi:hypothetical protein